MTVATAFLVSFAFAAVLAASGVIPLARAVLSTAKGSVAAVQDPALTDDEKEAAARAASVALMRSFIAIAGRTLLGAAGAMGVALLSQAAGAASWQSVAAVLRSMSGVPVTATGMALGLTLLHRRAAQGDAVRGLRVKVAAASSDRPSLPDVQD